jgi:hypothetical protein
VTRAERAAEIDELLRAYPDAVRETAAAARDWLTRVLPDIEEQADFGAKLIGYRYGPGYKGLVCTLILSKTGVKLGLFRGAELPDPKKLMAGEGKVHRHVQLRSPADLDRPGLKALLQTALKAWRARSAAAAK